MLELPSTRSADMRAGHAETGGGGHLDTGAGSPGDKWQLRELEQTQDSIAKETAKLAQEVQRLSKSVQESAKRVDAIPELLDTAPADGAGDSKGSVNAPVDSNVQAKAPIGTGEFLFIFVRAIRMTACFVHRRLKRHQVGQRESSDHHVHQPLPHHRRDHHTDEDRLGATRGTHRAAEHREDASGRGLPEAGGINLGAQQRAQRRGESILIIVRAIRLTACLFNQQVAHSGTVPNAKWATVYVDEEKRDAVRDAMRDAYNAYETYAMGEFIIIT